MTDILHGAWDCHVHTLPDVVPRKRTDLELAAGWKKAGMKGGVIKAHYADTTGRAALVREVYPELAVYGGLVLNRQAGGINPDAAERMAQAGGRYLWFPTMDSRAYQKRKRKPGPTAEPTGGLSLLGEDGRLLPAVYDVLDVAAEYRLIVGTGHVGGEEGLPLAREAKRRGVEKLVLTHAENPATPFPEEAQKECAALGAFVEHSYFTLWYHRVSWPDMIRQIRAVGVESCFLVTDFGQPDSPDSADGLRMFAEGLLARGFTETETEMMIRKNPERLFEE